MSPIPLSQVPMQKLEIKDFSGGKTDNHLGAALNKFKEADNLLLVKYGQEGKLRTRPGSELYKPDRVPYTFLSEQFRIAAIKDLTFNANIQEFYKLLFVFIQNGVFYSPAGGAFQELKGPTGNDAFSYASDATRQSSIAVWNNHLFITTSARPDVQKIFLAPGYLLKMVTAGLPVPVNSGVTYTAGARRYIYRVLFAYEYETGGKKYQDRGEYFQYAPVSTSNPISGINPVTFTALVPYVNTFPGPNYDTGSLKFTREFYRTTENGTAFFYVGSVLNGVTTFVDNTTDTTLQNNGQFLYTEGGIPENAKPPQCEIIHIINDTGYFANVVERGPAGNFLGEFPNRYYQSIPGDIDSVPRTFYDDMPDIIRGFSSYRNIPILMLDRGEVYRLDGSIDELGGGGAVKQRISSIAGCLSNQSIVQTELGLFWAGIDGFYFTDGFTVLCVSESIRDSYKKMTLSDDQKWRLQGRYDARNKQVHWTVQNTGKDDCRDSYVLDLSWGVSPDMPFTTTSGGENYAATALEFADGGMYRGDNEGYVYFHQPSYKTDPLPNYALPSSQWQRSAIKWNYLSVATDFGQTFERKWVSDFSIVCKNESNLSLAIESINDDGRVTGSLRAIRYRGNIVWGDPLVFWGDPSLIWNKSGLINEKRKFPAGGLRVQYKQMRLTNAYVAILNSDVLGTADVDPVTKTITRASNWPSNLEGYFISFEIDEFKREFKILSTAGGVLTVVDTGNHLLEATDSAWTIRGVPKGESLFLVSYVMNYTSMSASETGFRKGTTGEAGA